MSLRGAKRLRGEAEANSCGITRLLHFVRNDPSGRIATLPTVARNDKRGLRHSLDSSANGGLNELSPYEQAKAKLALCDYLK